MAYVPVPKDMNAVKTKVAFNLTKRQIVCFAAGAAVGRTQCQQVKGLWQNSQKRWLIFVKKVN